MMHNSAMVPRNHLPAESPCPGRAVRRLLAAVLIALPGAATAFEALTFRIPSQPVGLRGALMAASALDAAVREGTTDSQTLLAAAQDDYGRLLGALYGAGHYSGVITIAVDGREAADIAPLSAPDEIARIIVTVLPGAAFRLSRAEVAPLAPDTALPEGFAAGAPARAGVIGQAASAAVAGWRATGHAKAALAGQSVVADHAAATLDAALTIAPGPRLRFGPLAIEGTQAVRAERVRAIAGLPEGDVFSPDALERAATRLRRAGAFRSVVLREAEAAGADGTLAITAALVDEAPRRFGIGGEVASFDGITLGGYWLHRNLLGGAERLRFEAEASGIGAQLGGADYTTAFTLTRPATFTPDTALTLGARANSRNEDDFNSEGFTLNAGLAHYFSDRLTGEAGIAYTWSRVTDRIGAEIFQTFSAPLRLTWDRRDAPLDATRGFFLDGRLEPFVGLASAGTGARAQLDARAYRALGPRLVVAARAQAGTIFGATLRETPREMLFYSGGGGTVPGGGGSVRGQPFQSLGVFVLRADQKSGGRSFFATSGEVRVALTGAVGLVGFLDAGFVSPGEFFSAGEWHSGAGVGVRYATPIGPIRLDVAAPVSGDTGEGVQIYVGIGQAF